MSLTISRILHASYVFESGATRILFDPLFETPFSVNCYAFPKVEFDHAALQKLRLDAVVISHYHDDHCSFESLVHLDRSTPIYLYCVFDELFELIRELGFERVRPLSLNERLRIGEIEIVPRLALDPDVDSVYEIHAGDVKILNVVDSWLDPSTVEQLASQAPWDMVLWPFQTMRELAVLSPARAEPASREIPPEWLEQLAQLKPRVVVPSSCQFRFEDGSWMNHAMFPITYAQFEKEVRERISSARVLPLPPSFSYRLDSIACERAKDLNWVRLLGEPYADYEFDPQQVVPTTAEVAQHLNLQSDSRKVLEFCTVGLISRFEKLEPIEEGFFSKSRRWLLSVFDRDGAAMHFKFEASGSELRMSDDNAEPEWTTEIPAAKLLAALEDGEALTSLYVRINNGRFSDKVEAELEESDLMEDPLLRCLYNGAFASYQKAQLKRLRDERRI